MVGQEINELCNDKKMSLPSPDLSVNTGKKCHICKQKICVLVPCIKKDDLSPTAIMKKWSGENSL